MRVIRNSIPTNIPFARNSQTRPFPLFAALLTTVLLSTGCGIHKSFQRPKKKQQDPMMVRKILAPSDSLKFSGYNRAYSSWYADHTSLVARLKESPSVVRQLHARIQTHLRMMKDHMFAREAAVFDEEIIQSYKRLLEPWPGASPTIVSRRLNGIDGKIRRSFAPGKFPLKGPDDAAEEEED